MIFKYLPIFLIINVFVFCESAFVDTLKKCEIKDENCHKDFLKQLLKGIAKTGIPEIGVPSMDPMTLTNVTVKIADLIELTLIEGRLKGIKDCKVNRFVKNMEKGVASLELSCNVTINGKYKVLAQSPIVKTFLGGDTVHGKGNGKVKIGKLILKLEFPYFIQKRNGVLFVKCRDGELKYNFDIKGQISFFADQLYLGEVEASEHVIAVMNEFGPFLMKTFGDPFIAKAVDIIAGPICTIFYEVPVDRYTVDDMSPYAIE